MDTVTVSTKTEKTIEFWRKKLASGTASEVERAKAASELGHLAPHSHIAMDDLITALEEDELVRAAAIQALYALRASGVDVLAALREAIIVNNRANDKLKGAKSVLTGLPQVAWLADRMSPGWTEAMRDQPPPPSATEPPKFEESQE